MTTPEFSAQNLVKKTVIKSSKPKLADINYTSSLPLLTDFSDYIDKITGIEKQIDISLDYYNSLQAGDPVTELSNFFIDLNSSKFAQLDNEFIEFWSKRYDSLIQPIKDIVNTQIKDKKNYLVNTSDSIGTLVNTENKLDDAVTPTYDLYCSIYGAPNYIPVQLRNKISTITQDITKELSTKTTSLMRVNLRNIYFVNPTTSPYVDSTSPHGLNLVSDYKFFITYTDVFKTVFLNLVNLYDNLFTYIQYYNNIANGLACNLRNTSSSNKQIINNFYFSMDVENSSQRMDLLQNKITNALSKKTIKKSLSNQITADVNAATQSTGGLNQIPAIQNQSLPLPYDQIPEISNKISSGITDLNNSLTNFVQPYTSQLNIDNFVPSYLFTNFQIPTTDIANTIMSTIPLPAIPNFLPSQNNSLISTLTNAADFVGIIPGQASALVDAFPSAANSIASILNGGIPTDPMSMYNAAKEIKSVICNFLPPNFDLDFTSTSFAFNINFEDIVNKLLSRLPKFDLTTTDFSSALEGIATKLADQITSTFNNVLDNISKC